ncbi:hypothetical protein BABINDRAFT_15332 [Babjeviella inositovora NRRL Y-12698]|uniref:Altered inheritance of mitochondria protein 41 n=1 Tax=Babjeviella inositovora NRRL Y-12698 TaxID=984486 RepID=A0A1E3QJ01_9ASCO|nr:uncharacterized protein BABINDRAFT_15332 [Babjeviella inositovora NRRL Y-12698]ODQ77630.1 hypothetical protein BABINDRAFT_15332 [Babjeviella inositovora NRRL Y-12698]
MTSHAVDIPITDLDDDNDYLRPALMSDFDDDYSIPTREFTNLPPQSGKTSSFFDKIRSILTRKSVQALPEYYELQHTSQFATSGSESEHDSAVDHGQKVGKLRPDRILMLIFASFLFLIFVFAFVSKRNTEGYSKPILWNGTTEYYPTTIMISLDGFHPHYINSETTPHLHKMMANGYGTPYMVPSFPSSTFPNHWTMVTGLYPAEHGIVGNTFWDAANHRQFVNTKAKLSLPEYWWGGQPIWQTASYQGVELAVHMWPGSEVRFKNGNPMIVDQYNGSEVLSRKVDRMLGWLDLDISKRPELILGYAPTIDTLGHKYGVSGEQLKEGLTYVDTFIGAMVAGIELRNLTGIVNLIVVSDHGMAPTSNDRLVYLDDIVDTTKIEHTDGWPLYGLRPYLKYTVDEVYQELQSNVKGDSHYKVYLREEMPAEWNFGNVHRYEERIAPVWVVPDVGYAITNHSIMESQGNNYHPSGIHGYNNTEVLMRALFLAQGPYFKEKMGSPQMVKPFANTEIYNVICDTLNLVPLPNNGTTARVFSHGNALGDWQDDRAYPDVAFAMDSVVGNATYDILWGKAKGSKADNTDTKTEKKPAMESSSFEPDTTLSISSPSTSSPAKGGFLEHLGELWDDVEGFFGDVFGNNAKDDSDATKDKTEKVSHVIEDSVDKFNDAIEDGVEAIGEASKKNTVSFVRLQSTVAYEQLLASFKSDLKKAMIAKDGPKKTAIRNVMAVVKNKELEKMGKENNEFAAFDILSKIAQQRRDSIQQYSDASRTDLAEAEEYELTVVQEYLASLPVMSKAEISTKVTELINRLKEKAGENKVQMKDVMQAVNWKTLPAEWKASPVAVKAIMAQLHRELC